VPPDPAAGPLPVADLRPLLAAGPGLAANPVDGGPDERWRARADPTALDGLGEPMDGLGRLLHGFLFFNFLLDLPRRAFEPPRERLIYHDL